MGAAPIDSNVADGNLANRNIRLISANNLLTIKPYPVNIYSTQLL